MTKTRLIIEINRYSMKLDNILRGMWYPNIARAFTSNVRKHKRLERRAQQVLTSTRRLREYL